MSFRNDDVSVQVGANFINFGKEMKKGRDELRKFDKDAEGMAKGVVKAGALITTALAGVTTGLLAMINKASGIAAEIGRMADLAGVSAEQLQYLAAGSKTVGIEQEKLADILKDVNEKFGDFFSTGAGPLADFFENIAPKVGVTADEFARLSGPEALQLYVDSLEKAGVSQQQMTFYMEALASDASALTPLLRNSGAAMRAFGDEARDTGRIIDNDTIEAGRRLEKMFEDAQESIQNKMITSLIGLEDELLMLQQFVEEHAIPALMKLVEWGGRAAASFVNLSEKIKSLGGNPRFYDAQGNEYDQYNNIIASDSMTIGSPLQNNGSLLPPSSSPLSLEITPSSSPHRPSSGGGGGGGGGSTGPTREDFERLQQKFAEEAEIVAHAHEIALEELREFREAKLGTEEEYNDLEASIQQEHQDKLAAIERAAQQARVQAIAGAFGDMSALMQTENKKLFKIGQAAAMAEATVSGYSAAVSAWEKGMKVGGPPMAAAFTAASLVKTGALISSIASTSYSGGSSSGGGFGSSGVNGAPQQAAQTPLLVHAQPFDPSQLYSGAAGNALLDHLSDLAGDRGMTFG